MTTMSAYPIFDGADKRRLHEGNYLTTRRRREANADRIRPRQLSITIRYRILTGTADRRTRRQFLAVPSLSIQLRPWRCFSHTARAVSNRNSSLDIVRMLC